MESGTEKKQKISREKFLKICGSVLAGGSIVGLTGFAFHKNLSTPEEIPGANLTKQKKESFISPYKLVSSFKIPDSVDAIELIDDQLIVAASNQLLMYDINGKLKQRFSIDNSLRDIAADRQHIYLLFPNRVEVYDREGRLLRDWTACSEQSDYCSMAVTPDAVFATDAALKNMSKYTLEGNFVKFIQSPNGFIIPSYSFGITYANNIVYCSNSGRHSIEMYTSDGDYIDSFGKPGGVAGMFCGCCNPVHLTYTSTGEIITSEKGNPRISCYGKDGEFRSMLLDSELLGGGNTAYEIKLWEDKLIVAGKDLISTFQYDHVLAAKTDCSDCGVECPLRKGIISV